MIITLCGSTRFKKEYEEWNYILTRLGYCVFTVESFGHADKLELPKLEKDMLDLVHLGKIAHSDAVLVIDQEGYIGESTSKEIAWAKICGKHVLYHRLFATESGKLDKQLIKKVFSELKFKGV